MATKTKKTALNMKKSFGKKKEGILKKRYGPKAERPKKYRGQGR